MTTQLGHNRLAAISLLISVLSALTAVAGFLLAYHIYSRDRSVDVLVEVWPGSNATILPLTADSVMELSSEGDSIISTSAAIFFTTEVRVANLSRVAISVEYVRPIVEFQPKGIQMQTSHTPFMKDHFVGGGEVTYPVYLQPGEQRALYILVEWPLDAAAQGEFERVCPTTFEPRTTNSEEYVGAPIGELIECLDSHDLNLSDVPGSDRSQLLAVEVRLPEGRLFRSVSYRLDRQAFDRM